MVRLRIRRGLVKWLAIVVSVLIILAILFRMAVVVKPPQPDLSLTAHLERIDHGKDHYTCDDSWLKKNRFGLWEMYLTGSDIELGVKNGKLSRELIHFQEEVFIRGIQKLIPSDNYLRFLKFVVVWMNRNLDNYIPLEYRREIYGVALEASDDYSFIGPKYQRILNYHAAHDIGHALQNMNLVACTAFGVKEERSADGELLVGRNFDFSMGDDFAKNKIIVFYQPDKGYSFASITWGGMIGVVSGMNDQGLVVTLNAAKSGIPGSAKTPTSILARQILQHASTIQEAYELAGNSETFVSESFLISSAKDNRTVVFEKSPDELAIFDTGSNELILTNHFQSDLFRNSELTVKNREEGASVYRWDRTKELLDKEEKHDVTSFVNILRDQKGKGGTEIGMGNEMTVNQLIAHHSIIFRPSELKLWVSTFPYSLGRYLCYDLNRIFNDSTGIDDEIFNPDESIEEDPFLGSAGFRHFEKYKQETEKMKQLIEEGQAGNAGQKMVEAYLQLNPSYYYPYFLAGEYYRVTGNERLADEMYDESLSMEIPRKVDRETVLEAKEKLNEQ